MNKKRLLSILLTLLPVLSVILTSMPGAVVMRFFAGENGYFLEEVSGFDRILVGYGQVFPVLAGISACTTVLFAITGRDRKRIRSFAGAGAIFWCIGGLQGGFTWIGIAAAVLLTITAGIAHSLIKEERIL